MNAASAIMFKNWIPSDFRYEFNPIVGANPWVMHNSSARLQMNRSHVSQHLPFKTTKPNSFTTGMDVNLAKTTFAVKMPRNGRIKKIIPRYTPDEMLPPGLCPETLVIFQDENDHYDAFTLPKYFSSHQYFGFMYKPTENLSRLAPEQFFTKGTVFLDTPAVEEETGLYGYGRDFNIAAMTVNNVADDGIVGCIETMQEMGFDIIERVAISIKPGDIPLNIYGDQNTMKFFPHIGETVKKSALLFATRNIAQDQFPAATSRKRLRTIDPFGDNLTYLNEGGGTVIDIKVYTNTLNLDFYPQEFLDQIARYENKHAIYNAELISFFHKAKRNYGASLRLKDILNREIREAMIIERTRDCRVARDYHGSPIGEFRIEFTIVKEIIPNLQFKVTNDHGGKGVLVALWPRANMPRDEHGNIADFIVDPVSPVNRMNQGANYELREKEAARDLQHEICLALTGKRQPERRTNYSLLLKTCYENNRQLFDHLVNRVRGLYEIISEINFETVSTYSVDDWITHLSIYAKHGWYIHKSLDRQSLGINEIILLDRNYPSQATPVTFKDESGIQHTTIDAIPIAPMYMMLLEKIAKSDWTAISSAKLNTLGVIGKNTKTAKRSMPGHVSSIRPFGEAEKRLLATFTHPRCVAEIDDRNTSAVVHRHVTMQILTAPVPTNIDCLVDRTIFPFGSSMQLRTVDHMFAVFGIKMTYVDNSLGWNKSLTFKS